MEVPGVSRGKADVFATDAFVKVNCPPYLLALDLAHEVDDSRSSASITPGQVVFKLFKVGTCHARAHHVTWSTSTSTSHQPPKSTSHQLPQKSLLRAIGIFISIAPSLTSLSVCPPNDYGHRDT